MNAQAYSYSPLSLNYNIISVLVSIGITLLLIFIIFSTYYGKMRKYDNVKTPRGFTFIVFLYVEFIRNFTIQILGKKNEKFTPFFLYLFTYILFSNIISIFGLTNPTSSLSVTISLGLVTFLGIFVIGFKYQRLSFLKKYTFNVPTKSGKSIPIMINPINIAGQVAPLISISFRLWGNIFAGSLITSMVLASTQAAVDSIMPFDFINIIGIFALIPLHLYFDLLSGFIQTFVFVLLTLVYWRMEMKDY